MIDKCPGASTILQPTIKYKACPECGNQVEIVSTDMKVNCDKCGFTIYNDLTSCIQWCKLAKECVGEETYNRLMSEMKQKKQAQEK
jgi:DNA-directed RNA polymerase subunit RPC12/RpoP